MRSEIKCALCLPVLGLAASHASGQALQLNPGMNAGTFGTPYANMGLNNTQPWEVYRKLNGTDVVTAAVGSNNTQAIFANQDLGGPPYNFTGETFLGKTIDQSSPSAQLYLSSMILAQNPAPGSPGYDANLHTTFDLRIGFVQSGSTYVTAAGGDLGTAGGASIDPYDGGDNADATNGVYIHLGGGNTGSVTPGQPGNNWSINVNSGSFPANNGTYLFGQSSGHEGAGPAPLPVTITGISTVAAPADNGAAYNAPLELSDKLIPDPSTPGNEILEVKAGNTVYSTSFALNNPVFGPSGFNPATATPVIFTGKANFDGNNPANETMGVLAPGDANADGKVNVLDFNVVRANFGKTNQTWSTGDFAQTGTVNVADFNTVRHNFGVPIAGMPSGPVPAVLVSHVLPAVVPGSPPAPPASGLAQLEVNVTTGDVKIDGNGTSLSSYEIDSAGANLVSANLHSLASQYPGDGFVSFADSNTSISEGTLGNGPTLPAPTTLIDLGDIYRPGGSMDLQFLAFDNGSNEVDAGVKYFGSSVPEPGSLSLLGVASLLFVRRKRRSPV